MACLDVNNKFISQTNLGWTFSFEANGKYPMIANRIFATKAGAEAFIADTTANATAIPGLILRVIEDTAANNGAYLVEKDGETGLKLTRIVTGTLDISGEMINVIQYNGDASHEAGFYNKADGSGEPWVPSENAQPIEDVQVNEDGKYLCLVLNETDKVYIKSTDLIDLTDYYTKDQVDEKINMLDSSVSIALEDLKDYVDTQDEILEEKINALDSSLTLLKEYVDEQDTSIKNYVDSENDKIDQRLDGVDASITNITNEITNFVNAVEEKFDEIDTSLNNLTDDLVGVHETLDDIEERHEADVERIDEHLNNIDTSIEELKSVDASLDNKIDDVSLRLSQLEIGTVDSISTEGDYIHVDTSKGDVTFTADVVDSEDQVSFPSRGLVTDGYLEERLDVFNWVEVEDTENPPVERGVQQSDAPIQTTMNLATDDNTLSIISTGGDVTIE